MNVCGSSNASRDGKISVENVIPGTAAERYRGGKIKELNISFYLSNYNQPNAMLNSTISNTQPFLSVSKLASCNVRLITCNVNFFFLCPLILPDLLCISSNSFLFQMTSSASNSSSMVFSHLTALTHSVSSVYIPPGRDVVLNNHSVPSPIWL